MIQIFTDFFSNADYFLNSNRMQKSLALGIRKYQRRRAISGRDVFKAGEGEWRLWANTIIQAVH